MRRAGKLYSFFFLVCLLGNTLLLNGCAATQYGISEQSWKSLSPAQKKKMRENYRRIAATRAKEKLEQNRYRVTATTPKLRVEVQSGQAMMPPFDGAVEFEPVNFLVYQGHCQSVMLMESDGDKKTDLEACYLGNVLYLDPSKTEFQWHQGSLQFHYNPIWDSESGFVYNHISSQGYAGLKNTTIRVRSLTSNKT